MPLAFGRAKRSFTAAGFDGAAGWTAYLSTNPKLIPPEPRDGLHSVLHRR